MRKLFVLFLLAGCSGPIYPQSSAGDYLTTQHGSMRFGDALNGATQICARKGKGVKSLGTDTPPGGFSISRFECVNN